ncbi:Na(+)/H(+) exchange regulatory cofactor NHE-RF1-like [Ostrea edulis]|uniref:Na(+)/H(+) exchange regulatory cofactor NHE-RF1-like n=1 Tax=Ostrea edulis TaxID=37623 RepID=UPI0024AF0264|nr:Na(+)/H(+) exchange regulatory cofactor NHE-RF1-like [Ostrea edulis]
MADHKPRLCHLVKWPDFQGYGFNLHAERGKAGQFIGKVDDGSPAEAAGLKEGDRIVEINGTNIGNENHQQVVGRIKSLGDEVNLLVVDPDTDKYYKDIKQIVRSDLPEVVERSAVRNETQENSAEPEPTPEPQEARDPSPEREPSPEPVREPSPEPVREPSPEPEREPSPEPEREPSPEPEREPTPEPPREPSPEPEREPSPEPETNKENEEPSEPEPTVIAVNSVTNTEPDSKYLARLCNITKWPDFQGYGFNLHAERDRTGQFIGTIDDGSPAQAAGLQEGDRIIEVNGTNIESESHRQVIERVKAGGNHTTLLVVDSEADEYFRKNGISISASSPIVTKLSNPARGGSAPAPVNGTTETPAPLTTKTVQPAAQPQPVANGNSNDPMMGMSAKEMREYLASKRKQDPKKRGNLDFATKVNMLQKM